ncbi:MAG: helix-turn-helix domain-containing protein [Clostridiales bacterium]|nr:helix-turn-helix domain-containing protein [Clostridiales bacterium]
MYPNIEAERARAGLSRAQLAERLGVSYGTVKNWMQGATDIPCTKLIALSRMFRCSTDYLLGVEAAPPARRSI